jgi:biopolymer transport protein ExbD
MKKKTRKVPTLNSTSSADFALIILLFFLLTTSMDVDMGLARRLPPPVDPNAEINTELKVRERNVLKVFINTNNQILCGGDYIELRQLKDKAKAFILNESNDEHLPEKVTEDVPHFGPTTFTKFHVISLQNDRGTRYQAYLDVQNELVAAYNELRDDISRRQFGRRFMDLDEDLQSAVQIVCKQNISEAEPKNYGERK